MNGRILAFLIVIVFVGTWGATASDWFTGSWHAEIGLSPQQTSVFSSFESTLDVGLHLEFLEISSVSDFLFEGWLWQEFNLAADLGPISFDGLLLFDPQTASFLYAQGVFAIEFPPITLSVYSAIVGPTQTGPANYGYVLDIYGELMGGLITFESATFLGADLSEITFMAEGSQTDSTLLTKIYTTDPTIAPSPAGFCGQEFTFSALVFGCTELTSTTTFSTAGFESEELELSFLRLFGIPLILTLDIVYTTQTKSYRFTPSLETDYGCLFLYTNLLGGGGVITGVEIYGVKFAMSIAGATLTSISNLDTTQYVITTPAFGWIVEPLTEALVEGHLYYPQDYWEVLSLVVDVPPIGSGFSFSVDTFFSTSTGLLFEWAKSTMGITLALGSSVSMSNCITVDTTGFTEWRLSFDVAW